MVETKYQKHVHGWMSDAGGEYTSKAFIDMMKEKGIQINQSVPHAHQQNGRAERIIRTLMEKAESMRLQACLPQSWWEFTLNHATHVYNRTPMRRLEWCTPTEGLTLGARGGVLTQYITNTLQGNGQRT
jgi:transposase InsO family protein